MVEGLYQEGVMFLGETSSNSPAGLRDADGVRGRGPSPKDGAGLDQYLRPMPRT